MEDLFQEPASLTAEFPAQDLSRVVVGNVPYVCRDGVAWVRSSDPDDNGTRGCRLDSLAAAARTVGLLPPPGASDQCAAAEPCLRDAQGDLHCFVGGDRLPGALDATWTCERPVSPAPRREHYTHRYEMLGDALQTLVLTPDPPTLTTPEAPTTPEIPTTPDIPTTPEIPACDSSTPTTAPSSWQTCRWFGGRKQVACRVDADCRNTACADGVCTGSRAYPGLTYYDGKEAWAARLDQHKVRLIDPSGLSHAVRFEECTGDPDVDPAGCATAPRVGDGNDRIPSLRGAPVVPEYRVHFPSPAGDDPLVYLVSNRVELQHATQEGCAETLCALHASKCPAPHCRRDGDGDCVPNPAKVGEVKVG